MRERIILGVIFSLFLSTLIFSSLYLYELQTHPRVVLTNDIIKNMSKEEIIGFYQERERMESSDLTPEIFIISVGIIGFTLGISTAYLILERPKAKIEKDGILKLIPKNERNVIEVLIDKGGEAPQYYIRNRTGVNKVAMTRLIEKMEREGIIKVSRGRVNYVRLNEEIIKSLKKSGIL